MVGERRCRRRLSEEPVAAKPLSWDRRWSWQLCWGPLRRLYLSDMHDGQRTSWTPVGTVCLRCGHTELDWRSSAVDDGYQHLEPLTPAELQERGLWPPGRR